MGNTTSQTETAFTWNTHVTLTTGNVTINYKLSSDGTNIVKRVIDGGSELVFNVDPKTCIMTQGGAAAGTDGDIDELRKAVTSMQETINTLLSLEEEEEEEEEDTEEGTVYGPDGVKVEEVTEVVEESKAE